MQNVLTDRQLWGEDALAILANLQNWSDAGETSIQIFSDRVVSSSKYDSLPAAQQISARLSSFLKRPPKLRAEYQGAYQASFARAAAFRISGQKLLEDDAFHVVLQREGGDFLKPGIPIRSILDRFGQPEKQTSEVIQADGDRRPVVLTVYWYADGAVKFAQSDLSPAPNTVDRVIVDVTRVAAQLH